jgi:hypothetical protein
MLADARQPRAVNPAEEAQESLERAGARIPAAGKGLPWALPVRFLGMNGRGRKDARAKRAVPATDRGMNSVR